MIIEVPTHLVLSKESEENTHELVPHDVKSNDVSENADISHAG